LIHQFTISRTLWMLEQTKGDRNKVKRVLVDLARTPLKIWLQAAYDPRRKFFRSTLPANYIPSKYVEQSAPVSLANEYRLLDIFEMDHPLRQDKKNLHLENLLEAISPSEQLFMGAVLAKDLSKWYLTADLVLEVYPNLFPRFQAPKQVAIPVVAEYIPDPVVQVTPKAPEVKSEPKPEKPPERVKRKYNWKAPWKLQKLRDAEAAKAKSTQPPTP